MVMPNQGKCSLLDTSLSARIYSETNRTQISWRRLLNHQEYISIKSIFLATITNRLRRKKFSENDLPNKVTVSMVLSTVNRGRTWSAGHGGPDIGGRAWRAGHRRPGMEGRTWEARHGRPDMGGRTWEAGLGKPDMEGRT